MADCIDTVALPRYLINEVLTDGVCSLHLRVQLSRTSSHDGAARQPTQGLLAEPRCFAGVAAFLDHHDVLSARTASAGMLGDVMQPDPFSSACTFHDSKSALTKVHDRIRARLWMEKLAVVTVGSPDESVFETRVRSFVDEATKRRLESELTEAKARMEREVREAKESMLQCVQAVSEEVDRRVRDKVASLQAEFERRTDEQAKALREMVERRVFEQTSALQAEVDRRTNAMKSAMEHRAHEHEASATKLRIDVMNTRIALEERVQLQEKTAVALATELQALRTHLLDLASIRDILEARLLEQEKVAESLKDKLAAAMSAPQSRQLGRASNACCWSFLSASARALPSVPARQAFGGNASFESTAPLPRNDDGDGDGATTNVVKSAVLAALATQNAEMSQLTLMNDRLMHVNEELFAKLTSLQNQTERQSRMMDMLTLKLDDIERRPT